MLQVRIEVRNGLTDVRQQAACRALRRGQTVGERIGQRRDVGLPAVARSLYRSGLREAGLDRQRRIGAERVEEDAIAGPQHRLLIERPGQPDARHDVVLLALERTAPGAVLIDEGQTAAHAELVNRELGYGVARVIGARRRFERVRLIEGEARDQAVEAFGQRRLEFVTRPNIDGQLARDLEVVVQVEAELSSGPRVKLLLKLRSGEVDKLKRLPLARYRRNSVPNFRL